jgi:chromosome partitioning protein
MATVILIGNEKGGAGKTTIAIHITAALLYLGFKVSSIDLDIRQGSLSKYIENRNHSIKNLKLKIPSPKFCKIEPSKKTHLNEAYLDEQNQLNTILAQEHPMSDFIVIDTPGVNNPLSTLAHSFADIIITPINDSFLDISVLADVDPSDLNIIKPGVYSQIIWEQKINRAKRDGSHINWIITRNRLHSLDSNNQRNIEKVIVALSKRMGCKIAAGFGERVIFKELFLKGLTLLDLKEQGASIQFTPSHIAAKQELISLLHTMNNESITSALAAKVL